MKRRKKTSSSRIVWTTRGTGVLNKPRKKRSKRDQELFNLITRRDPPTPLDRFNEANLVKEESTYPRRVLHLKERPSEEDTERLFRMFRDHDLVKLAGRELIERVSLTVRQLNELEGTINSMMARPMFRRHKA